MVPVVEQMDMFSKRRRENHSAHRYGMGCVHFLRLLQAAKLVAPSDRCSQSEWTWPQTDDSWVILQADVTKAHRRIMQNGSIKWLN